MNLAQTIEILVCVRCRPLGAPPDEPRAGLSLSEAVQEEAFKLDAEFAVRPERMREGILARLPAPTCATN